MEAKARAREAKAERIFSKLKVNSRKFHASKGSKDEARIAEFLREVLCHGNEAFSEGLCLMIKAAAIYTGCLLEATSLEKEVDCGSDENINTVLKLAHSNRAEAMLRLQKVEEAALDAEVALTYDRAHWKSWSRWGGAMMRLERYEKAFEIFTTVLKNCPNDLVIREYLVSCTKRLAEARTGGEKNNPVEVNGGHQGQVSLNCAEHSDFIGPVEIRRVGYGAGRRGVLATELISAQELSLACNAICYAGMLSHFADSLGDAHGRLFFKLMDVVKSTQSLAQLYILASAQEEELAISSLGIFESHCNWSEDLKAAACDMKVNLKRITAIIGLNAVSSTQEPTDEESVLFQSGGPSTVREGGEVEEFLEHAATVGLWILPSLLNHSCVPNSMQMSIIEVKYVIALRDVQPGEELTISHLRNLFVGLKDRGRNLPFECRCERCALEKKLDVEFSQITSRVGSLVTTSKEEFANGRGTFRPLTAFSCFSVHLDLMNDSSELRATKELSDFAHRVEALIGACKSTHDSKIGFAQAFYRPISKNTSS